MNKAEIFLLTAIALLVAGCGAFMRSHYSAALRATLAIRSECQSKRLAGELKNYTDQARCTNERARQEMTRSGYRYTDLVELYLAYDGAVAERLDRGELSEADERLLLAKLTSRINGEARRRHAMEAQALNQWLQVWSRNEQAERLRARNDVMLRDLMRGPIVCQDWGPGTITCW